MPGAQGATGDVAKDGGGSSSFEEGSDEDEEAKILKSHLYSDFLSSEHTDFPAFASRHKFS
jgi:hypothetical protein